MGFLTVAFHKICSVLLNTTNLQKETVCMILHLLGHGNLLWKNLSGNCCLKLHTSENSQYAILYDDELLNLTFLIHKMRMLVSCPKDVNSNTRLCPLP